MKFTYIQYSYNIKIYTYIVQGELVRPSKIYTYIYSMYFAVYLYIYINKNVQINIQKQNIFKYICTGWSKKSLWCDLEEKCLGNSKIVFDGVFLYTYSHQFKKLKLSK